MITSQKILYQYLETFKKESKRIYASSNREGYWSNLSRQQNSELMSLLGTRPTRECIDITQPLLKEIIFYFIGYKFILILLIFFFF